MKQIKERKICRWISLDDICQITHQECYAFNWYLQALDYVYLNMKQNSHIEEKIYL